MLQNRSLVYFAKGHWDGLWRNRQQLMSIFAQYNKVLYVENRVHFRQVRRRVRQGDLKTGDLAHPVVRRAENVEGELYVFRYPLWLPVSGRSAVRRFIDGAQRRLLQRTLTKLQFFDPIVWYSHPSMFDLLGYIPNPSATLYHVVDEYQAYGNQTAKRIERLQKREQLIFDSADAVVVVSQNLLASKGALHPHTYLVPNGVNYEAYEQALSDSSLPNDLQSIPRPRLGYSGLIGDRLNIGLLNELARSHPDWSLVLIGNADVTQQAEEWQRLYALSNVYYLGQKSIEQVPHYLKGFDVGLMPYRQSWESENISPLKLYDYLAAGLPVATIDIPAARAFADVTEIAITPRDFEAAVCTALSTRTEAGRLARRHVASQHTWRARAEQISEIVEKHLVSKTAVQTKDDR